MPQSTGRIQQLFKQYGRTAVGVHLAVYTASFTGLYVAIERGLDPHKLLSQYGLLSDKAVKEDGDSDKRGWFANLLSGPGSTVALAFLCNKALLPVRVPITVGLTPAVARLLQNRSAATAATKVASAHQPTPTANPASCAAGMPKPADPDRPGMK